MQKLPLSMRKANLQRLLARRPEGIFVSTLEQGEIGPDLFRKACEWDLKGWFRSIATGLTAPVAAALDQGERPEVPGDAAGQARRLVE